MCLVKAHGTTWLVVDLGVRSTLELGLWLAGMPLPRKCLTHILCSSTHPHELCLKELPVKMKSGVITKQAVFTENITYKEFELKLMSMYDATVPSEYDRVT